MLPATLDPKLVGPQSSPPSIAGVEVREERADVDADEPAMKEGEKEGRKEGGGTTGRQSAGRRRHFVARLRGLDSELTYKGTNLTKTPCRGPAAF